MVNGWLSVFQQINISMMCGNTKIATKKWSLMKGDGTVGQAPVYGEKGVAHTANTPGARKDYAAAIDENDKYLVCLVGT